MFLYLADNLFIILKMVRMIEYAFMRLLKVLPFINNDSLLQVAKP